MKIIIFTPTKRNVQFHFSMWVLIKMNMVLKIHDYEKCHFHCHKNRN